MMAEGTCPVCGKILDERLRCSTGKGCGREFEEGPAFSEFRTYPLTCVSGSARHSSWTPREQEGAAPQRAASSRRRW